LYGARQERLDPDQLLLFDSVELEALVQGASEPVDDEPSSPEATAPRRRRGHGRRPLPAHLPREQRLYELSEEERCCPDCGALRQEIGRQTSEQLDYVPASYKVIEHARVKYACRHCQDQVAIAPKPPQPVEKGLPAAGLLAQVVLAKYGDHAPLYRQEDISARHGLVLRRSTLCDWVAAAADLAAPLYTRMADLVKESRVLHADDTPVKLLDPLLGQTLEARFWAYVGDGAHRYCVYDFTESRKRDGPAKFLASYEGYLQADAYGGYDGIFTASGGKIIEVACWAHCRRYWWEAIATDSRRAHEALSFIARLYQVEEAGRQHAREARRALRQEHALPVLGALRHWLDESCARVLPKSPIGKAATYTLNQWDALMRYTEDGDLAIDNNISERTVKVLAMGRKAWLFVGSPRGGQRAAILFSLIASAKASQVEPWAWLRDIFDRLPLINTDDVEQLDALLPDLWLAANPTHRWQIDALRHSERQASKRSRNQQRRNKPQQSRR
jgi:transposase